MLLRTGAGSRPSQLVLGGEWKVSKNDFVPRDLRSWESRINPFLISRRGRDAPSPKKDPPAGFLPARVWRWLLRLLEIADVD